MNDKGKIGDKAGYVVLEQDNWGNWMDTSSGLLDDIGQAVAQLRHYQAIQRGGVRQSTFGIGRVQLCMISRPEEADA